MDLKLNYPQDLEQTTDSTFFQSRWHRIQSGFRFKNNRLDRDIDIIQIAGKEHTNSFNRYVIPSVDIQIEVSKITGITYIHGTNKMYILGEIVEPVSLHTAPLDF